MININSDGSGLIYSTYLGGSKDDDGEGIAVDITGNAYVVGTTKSKNDFPLESALQPFFGGQEDVFLTKVGDAPLNNPPIITSTPVIAGIVNQPYSYDIDAEDQEGDVLTYSLAVAPVGMVINSATGIISWTPSELGEFPVTVLVDDSNDGIAAQSYSLTIEPPPNQPPQITSTPVTEGHVSSFYIYSVIATDADNDSLTYILNTAPVGMVTDSGTGLISWSEPVVGTHAVGVQVNDGQGGIDNQNYSLTITAEPVITSSPATLTFINENYFYDVNAFEPNNLILTYLLSTAPEGMAIDTATGEIEWTPNTAGNFDISITVENEQGEQVSQQFTLSVLGENDLLIVSEPETEAYVGEPYTYAVSVIGKQTDNLDYVLLNPPTGMSINTDGTTVWIPQSSGDFQIQIAVSNSLGGSDTQSFTVNVKTLEEMDAMFNAIWNGMFQDLISGDKQAALQRFSSEVIIQYEPVLEVLLPFMNEISSNYTDLERITIGADTSDYVTRRVEGGGVDIFFITFVKDKDGEWKLYSM